mmetsp:Transcript_138216/g.195646  ORF Transcript_138216/g.195646 Transcript_138216/m.195646 type:complete len:173 (+) Transcript_138216:54-572(+)
MAGHGVFRASSPPRLLRTTWVLALSSACLFTRNYEQGFTGWSTSLRPSPVESVSRHVSTREGVDVQRKLGPRPEPDEVRTERLLKEITNNTPGLARSAAPQSEGGGIRLLWAPEPHERVDFALWFGPLPCFQVGTFRYCFCLSQTVVLTGLLLALAVAILGPEILMSPRTYG